MSDTYRLKTKLTAFSVMLLIFIGLIGVILSCGHQTIVPQQKTASSFSIPKDIIIRRGEPFTPEKKELIGKTLTDKINTRDSGENTDSQKSMKEEMIEINSDQSGDNVFFIAAGWGQQLKPPDELKRSVINLTEAVNRYTNLNAKVNPRLYINSRRLLEIPFVYITSDEAFELTKGEAINFGQYLRNGGFAVIDNGQPETEFSQAEKSLRQMLRDALGKDAKFLPIENDHPLYHCFFDFDDGPPTGAEFRMEPFKEVHNKDGISMQARGRSTRVKPVNYLEGIWIDNRLVAIYSDKGYGYRWKDLKNNIPQIKFGVNMVVYALLQEGSNIQQKSVSKNNSMIKGNGLSLTETDFREKTPKELFKEISRKIKHKAIYGTYINLSINKQGNYDVDGISAKSSDLKRIVKEELEKKNSNYVVIHVHPSASHENYTFASDTVAGLGADWRGSLIDVSGEKPRQ